MTNQQLLVAINADIDRIVPEQYYNELKASIAETFRQAEEERRQKARRTLTAFVESVERVQTFSRGPKSE